MTNEEIAREAFALWRVGREVPEWEGLTPQEKQGFVNAVEGDGVTTFQACVWAVKEKDVPVVEEPTEVAVPVRVKEAVLEPVVETVKSVAAKVQKTVARKKG